MLNEADEYYPDIHLANFPEGSVLRLNINEPYTLPLRNMGSFVLIFYIRLYRIIAENLNIIKNKRCKGPATNLISGFVVRVGCFNSEL